MRERSGVEGFFFGNHHDHRELPAGDHFCPVNYEFLLEGWSPAFLILLPSFCAEEFEGVLHLQYFRVAIVDGSPDCPREFSCLGHFGVVIVLHSIAEISAESGLVLLDREYGCHEKLSHGDWFCERVLGFEFSKRLLGNETMSI